MRPIIVGIIKSFRKLDCSISVVMLQIRKLRLREVKMIWSELGGFVSMCGTLNVGLIIGRHCSKCFANIFSFNVFYQL